PMSTAIRALGYASVGLIAGQTIAGMAHDGIDNIPREGTWLLDRGERVVDRRTNSDLKDYLADRNNGRGQPVVNVHTLPGTTAVASTNDDGSLDIRIQKLAEQTVANQLKNPNSRISQTMSQNYNSQRRR
ncbi:phage tail tape measure protein, partial [Acinetobacter sichuanensis]